MTLSPCPWTMTGFSTVPWVTALEKMLKNICGETQVIGGAMAGEANGQHQPISCKPIASRHGARFVLDEGPDGASSLSLSLSMTLPARPKSEAERPRNCTEVERADRVMIGLDRGKRFLPRSLLGRRCVSAMRPGVIAHGWAFVPVPACLQPDHFAWAIEPRSISGHSIFTFWLPR